MPTPQYSGPVHLVRIQQAELPPLLGWQPVLGGPHEEIHNGHYFRMEFFGLSVGNGDYLEMMFLTGEYETHWTGWGACGGDAHLQFWEDVTYTDPGVELPVKNANRRVQGLKVNFTKAYASVVGLVIPGDPEKELIDKFVPGGTVGTSQGGEVPDRPEWVLDPEIPGTPPTPRAYLLRMTNISGLAQPMSIEVGWYEPRGTA